MLLEFHELNFRRKIFLPGRKVFSGFDVGRLIEHYGVFLFLAEEVLFQGNKHIIKAANRLGLLALSCF